jgi:charged multivesicular body protein 4
MDFLGIFGKSKSKKTQEAEAEAQRQTSSVINNLREQVELMEKRNGVIKTRMDTAFKDAQQKLARKDKNGALIALKRKKQYEAEIEKNQGIQIVLENQIYALEGATMQKAIVDAMAMGNKSIKKLNTELNPEKIEELMDDIQEEADNFKSIQDAMSQPLQQIYNDSELLEELAQLESEELASEELASEELASASYTTFTLPPVPTGTLSSADDEIKQLQESMLIAS